MIPRGVWPWGIQVGPYAVHETYFCKMNLHFINRPHAAFPISCIQWNGQPTCTQKWMAPRGVWPWGIQIWSLAVHETHFCKMDFHFINQPHAAFPASRNAHPTKYRVGVIALAPEFYASLPSPYESERSSNTHIITWASSLAGSLDHIPIRHL